MRRLNKSVRFWYEQFMKEGEHSRAAWYHAVNRAYEEGAISGRVADKLEASRPPEVDSGE